MKRREFIRFSGSFIMAAVLAACTKKQEPTKAPVAKKTPQPPAQETVTFITEDNMMAKNLKYVEDATKADPALRAKRGDTEGKDQVCTNCQFYKPAAGKDYGKCDLLQGGYVKTGGWCASWVLKTA